jgi:hypothetical protein
MSHDESDKGLSTQRFRGVASGMRIDFLGALNLGDDLIKYHDCFCLKDPDEK